MLGLFSREDYFFGHVGLAIVPDLFAKGPLGSRRVRLGHGAEFVLFCSRAAQLGR